MRISGRRTDPGSRRKKETSTSDRSGRSRGRCRAIRHGGQLDGWTAQTLGRMSPRPALVQLSRSVVQPGPSPAVLMSRAVQSTPSARAVARCEAIALAKPRHCSSGWWHPAGDEQREGSRRLDVGCVCCIGGAGQTGGTGIGPWGRPLGPCRGALHCPLPSPSCLDHVGSPRTPTCTRIPACSSVSTTAPVACPIPSSVPRQTLPSSNSLSPASVECSHVQDPEHVDCGGANGTPRVSWVAESAIESIRSLSRVNSVIPFRRLRQS